MGVFRYISICKALVSDLILFFELLLDRAYIETLHENVPLNATLIYIYTDNILVYLYI